MLAKRLLGLKVENARLALAVVLTRLAGALVFLIVALILVLAQLGFVTAAMSTWLCEIMPAPWAYLIIAAFYVILLYVVKAVKKPLIINPISRFMSKLIVEPPKNHN